jgi:hypothetical protein
VILSALTFAYSKATVHVTKLTSLVVHAVPVGATVTAVCPKGCARKRLVLTRAHGNVSLKRLFGHKALRVNTRITVTVAKPGSVSAVKVLTIRKGKGPTVASLCQPPGAPKPTRCT